MRYDYDMLGNRIHQASMEAGERWMLNDVAGKPIRAWDSRGFIRRMTYDALRRPTGTVRAPRTAPRRLAERTDLRRRPGRRLPTTAPASIRCFDGAGVVTSDEPTTSRATCCDSRRELLPDYKQAVDWQQNPAAE